MNFSDLFKDALGLSTDLPDVEVEGIAQDSRRVKAGFVFVARSGELTDGHRFVERAIAAGAVAIVGERSAAERQHFSWHGRVPYIQIDSSKAATSKLAATFYGHPSKALFTVGVTGTDGKTTTAYLLHHLLSGSYRTGLLSTAGVKLGDDLFAPQGHFTTPEAPEVQALLAQFRDAGLTHAVIESSSHGFAQKRLAEVDYDIGIWTNLSPEHLDYHKTLEHYRAAKATLMRRAPLSILNADDSSFDYFANEAHKTVSYGIDSNSANWRATELQEEAGLLRWRLLVNAEDAHLDTQAALPMVGRYNLYNALAALAAGYEVGIAIPLLLERLASFPGVPGRMQIVQREPFTVVVDFAHTAPALAGALEALRPQTRGRLIVVIGAAGERDPGKRAPLAEAAARYANLVMFTEEDSRSEDVHVILEQMQRGAEAAGGQRNETFWLEPNRREAIGKAIGMAQAGDLVLLAGKGHETTLERKDDVLEWNEVEEAKRALR